MFGHLISQDAWFRKLGCLLCGSCCYIGRVVNIGHVVIYIGHAIPCFIFIHRHARQYGLKKQPSCITVFKVNYINVLFAYVHNHVLMICT